MRFRTRNVELAEKEARLAEVPEDRFPTVARLAGSLVRCDAPDDYLRRGLDLLVLGLRGLAPSG